ncbi:MAG: anthranilate synthase component I [bacterium]|nr:anthranilate synthase component I [bacterium]
MYLLSKDFFMKNAIKHKFFPVYKKLKLDTETIISAFLKVRDDYKYFYLLESVEGNANIGRYSFIGLGADLIFKAKGNEITLIDKEETTIRISEHKNPIKDLEVLVKSLESDIDFNLPPFYGGAVGYIGYDAIRYFEKIAHDPKKDDLNIYDMYFIFAKDIIVFDKVRNSITILANVMVGDNLEQSYDDAVSRIERLESKLSNALSEPKILQPATQTLKFTSNTKKQDFLEMVNRGKQYIYDGDIFQVVLSQRFETEYPHDDFEIYRKLRSINPSPYMFYLKFDDYSTIGASPEVMVKSIDNKILVRPIAGTRSRGKTPQQDLAFAKELLADEKECAEHMMLVDLGRNDVGRVAKPATVKLDTKMVIERYSHVMHIVSQVIGEVDSVQGFSEIFGATFPAGTVSGAPKIRAMEIIEELEKNKRGVYSGSVAYLNGKGNFDTCIAIRTIFKKGDKLYVQAGAGIVADSVPETEFNETLNKAKAVFSAVAETLGMNDLEFEYIKKESAVLCHNVQDPDVEAKK